jgi:hypothetical protein
MSRMEETDSFFYTNLVRPRVVAERCRFGCVGAHLRGGVVHARLAVTLARAPAKQLPHLWIGGRVELRRWLHKSDRLSYHICQQISVEVVWAPEVLLKHP